MTRNVFGKASCSANDGLSRNVPRVLFSVRYWKVWVLTPPYRRTMSDNEGHSAEERPGKTTEKVMGMRTTKEVDAAPAVEDPPEDHHTLDIEFEHEEYEAHNAVFDFGISLFLSDIHLHPGQGSSNSMCDTFFRLSPDKYAEPFPTGY